MKTLRKVELIVTLSLRDCKVSTRRYINILKRDFGKSTRYYFGINTIGHNSNIFIKILTMLKYQEYFSLSIENNTKKIKIFCRPNRKSLRLLTFSENFKQKKV